MRLLFQFVLLLMLSLSLISCQANNLSHNKDYPELDAALKKYTAWKTVSTEVKKEGNMTNFRSDAEYQEFTKVVSSIPPEEFSNLQPWIKTNYNQLPSPFYWSYAAKAFKSKQPVDEVAKWLSIGQITARYDLSRCTDSSSSGAYTEVVMHFRPLFIKMKEHPEKYKEGISRALGWLEKREYQASPMWICSHGMAAFGAIGDTEKPVTYNDLVLPQEKQPTGWFDFLEQVRKGTFK